MANIKSYKDGDRLILVIENCNGELAVKANNSDEIAEGTVNMTSNVNARGAKSHSTVCSAKTTRLTLTVLLTK